jgi:integrase
MASLRKQRSSSVWYAQFYVADETGKLKQVRKSTGQKSRSKAKGVAAEMERAARSTMEAASDQSTLAKGVLAEAVNELEQGRFNAVSARKHLARLLEISTGEQLQQWTVESWAGEWLRRKGQGSSKATMARYAGHMKSWLEFLGTAQKKPLESVTPQQVRAWRESLLAAGRGAKTVSGYLKDLSGCFRSAIREGILTVSPCGALEALQQDTHDRKPFTSDEVAALIQAAPSEQWKGLILTAAFTGLRLADAARLSWDSIDLDAKQICLMPAKTKRKKVEVRIPIQEDLLAYLLAAPVADDSPQAFVFPDLAKRSLAKGAGLSKDFPRIMAAAGVSRGKASEKQGAGRVNHERGFHSLRHTFVSFLANSGISEETRMALTGHTTRDAHQIYTHHEGKTLADAIASLPSLSANAEASE